MCYFTTVLDQLNDQLDTYKWVSVKLSEVLHPTLMLEDLKSKEAHNNLIWAVSYVKKHDGRMEIEGLNFTYITLKRTQK